MWSLKFATLELSRATFNTENFTLAVLRTTVVGAYCAVVIEEAVMAGTVNDDTLAVQNTEAHNCRVSIC